MWNTGEQKFPYFMHIFILQKRFSAESVGPKQINLSYKEQNIFNI